MKMGILVPSLGASYLSYCMLNNVNKFIRKTLQDDIIVFYENLARPVLWPEISVMQIAEAWGYEAPVVSTNISTTQKLIQFPAPTKKIFYVWDLEWVRMGGRQSFEALHNIYGNKQLTIITRCKDYAKMLEDAWNIKTSGISEDFNLEKIMEIANATT